MKHITHMLVHQVDRYVHTCNDRLDDLVWTARLVRPIVTFVVCKDIVRMDELMGFSSAIVQPILSSIGLTMKLAVWGDVGWPFQDGGVFFDLPWNRTARVQFRGLVELILRFHVGQYDLTFDF